MTESKTNYDAELESLSAFAKNQFGRIVVDQDFFRNDAMYDTLVMGFFAIQFLPLAVEHSLSGRQYIFFGSSPKFQAVQLGCIPPTYTMTFHRDKQGKISLEELTKDDGTIMTRMDHIV